MIAVLILSVTVMVVILFIPDSRDSETIEMDFQSDEEIEKEPSPTQPGETAEQKRQLNLLVDVISDYISAEEFHDAQRTLSGALKRFPGNPRLLSLQNRYDKVLSEFNSKETRFKAYCESAERAEESSQWSLAVVNYENAIRIHPTLNLKNALKRAKIAYHLDQAETYIHKKEFQKAHESAAAALELEKRPEIERKIELISGLLSQERKEQIRNQNFTKAKNQAEEFLAKNKYSDALKYFDLAGSFVGSTEQARYIDTRMALCRKSIRKIKKDAEFEALMAEGNRLEKKGKPSEAVRFFSKALALTPQDRELAARIEKMKKQLEAGRITDAAGIEMVFIPGGEYSRGNENEKDANPVRTVMVSSFYIDRSEVTNSQYEKFDPFHKRSGFSPDDDSPVTNVTWDQALAYCRWRGKLNSAQYRLPTEAEWEKAAKGGTAFTYSWGNTFDPAKGNIALTKKKATPGGTFPANRFGLYDMSGNVWEWCYDWYSERYYGSSPLKDPQGPEKGEMKTVRGGSFRFGKDSCTTYSRNAEKPDSPGGDIGFRTVRIIENGKGE